MPLSEAELTNRYNEIMDEGKATARRGGHGDIAGVVGVLVMKIVVLEQEVSELKNGVKPC